MTQTYTTTVSDTDHKAMEYVTTSPQDWSTHAVENRIRIAKDEIIAKLVEHCNANEIALAVGVDAQITQAFDLGVVKTATQRNADAIAAETPNAE